MLKALSLFPPLGAADHITFDTDLGQLIFNFSVIISLAILPFLLVFQVIRYRYLHPLKEYPGPFWAGVTRLWLAWHSYHGTELEACRNAVIKYG